MSRRAWLLVAAVLAAAGILMLGSVALWSIVGDDDDSEATGEQTLALADDASELADQAKSVGHVVYWVGPVARRRYELTKTADGRAYVRYLPRDVEAGDPRPGFLTVGTYLLEDAYSVTRATSRRSDSRVVRGPAGAVAFYSLNRPQSVYLAFEGSDLQIEVFHPSPRQARKLVSSGRVRPVG